jgi:hypothetical protein
MRRRVLAVAAVLALALSSAALAAGLPAQLQFDETDQSWAKTILVGKIDLDPTWELVPGSGEGGDPRDYNFCPPELGPDESDLTITGGNASTLVRSDGGALVLSSATVWQTAEHAQADWDRTVQPPLLNCVAAGLSASGTKKIKIVVTGKRTLAFPSLSQRTAAYRFSLAYKTTVKVRKKKRTITLPATFDLVLLSNGRATAQLGFLSFNKVPMTDFQKQRASMGLARRILIDPKR